MTGKVRIVYAKDAKDEQLYEATLEYGTEDERIYMWAASRNSFEEAKERVIAKFKSLPEPEDIEVG